MRVSDATGLAHGTSSGWHKAPNKNKSGEHIIEWWDGRFPFAKIVTNSVVVGYGVTCGLHVNRNGLCDGTLCKKSVYIGQTGLSEDDARLRLNRWLVYATFHDLDPEQQRQSHIGLGGPQLAHLGSDVLVRAELDPDLDRLLHGCK